MRTLIAMLGFVVLMSQSVYSQNKAEQASNGDKEALKYRKTGGYVIKKGTFCGKIVLLDTQNKVDFSNIQQLASQLANVTECNIIAAQGSEKDPVAGLNAYGANAIVVIVDNTSPTMLVAPEERWATVNVANLVGDLPSEKAKSKFLPSRCRKEVLRAFSLLCGGGSSQFPGNSMNCANVRELDFAVESIPVDMISNYQQYLKKIGVTQKEYITYRRACKEGWAPAPTNDVQKTIWDKVHAAPKAPMKIEFDAKKGR